MNLTSQYKIIGFSGITTSSYYFWLSSSFLIDYNQFIFQNIFLLFFSIVFFYFSFHFLKKFFLQNIFFTEIINILITTWVLVITIKTLFYLANVTTLPDFIRDNVLSYEESLFNRLIVFTIPYIFTLLFIILSKKYISKVQLLISSLGFVLIFLITFNIISEIIFKYNIQKFPTQNNLATNHLNKKVIWIIFDEFDPEIAFSKKNKKIMKNFNKIKDDSIYVPNYFSTAKNTLYAMSSTLINKPIEKLFIKKRIIFIDDGQGVTPFVYKNSLFKKLQNKGFNFKILSSVFPYCYHLQLNYDQCISISMSGYSKFNPQFYAGCLHVFSPLKKFNRFLELSKNNEKITKNDFILTQDTETILNLKPKIKEEQLTKFDEGVITFEHFNEALSSNKNLVFLHIFLPHLGKEGDNFSQKIFETNVSGYENQYLLNLKATDLVLGKILNNIDKLVDDKHLLILSSDHWFRNKDLTTDKSYPALLLLKISNENQYLLNNKKISSTSINEIIHHFLDSNVDTHNKLNQLLNVQKFFKPFSYKGSNF